MDDARPDTLGNAGTPEERRTGLGGSDAAAALGLSPWRSQYDLWEEKVGHAPPVEQNEAMLWGQLLENIIRAEYASRTGQEVVYRKDLIRHPARPWMFTHLDGEIGRDGRAILEVKTSRTGQGWGEPDTDDIPTPYLIQVHHALAVTAAEICDIAVLIGGQDFRLYHVERDIEIEQQLIEGEALFWEKVVQGVPPDPMTVADAVKRWGHFNALHATMAGEAELHAIEILRRGHALRKELDEHEEEAKKIVMSAMADSGQTLIDARGEVLATWKLDNGRKGYSVAPREPARQFRVKYLDE